MVRGTLLLLYARPIIAKSWKIGKGPPLSFLKVRTGPKFLNPALLCHDTGIRNNKSLCQSKAAMNIQTKITNRSRCDQNKTQLIRQTPEEKNIAQIYQTTDKLSDSFAFL
jgi:hypothetical protein